MKNNLPVKGGKRPGAGRPKGVPNKATIARQQQIAATGLTPLDYMLQVLRDENAEADTRKWAAQNAAPYVHPRLANVAVEHELSERLYDWLIGSGE